MRLPIPLVICALFTAHICDVFGAAVTAEEEACESGLSKCSEDDITQFFDCAEGQWIDRVCAPGSVCVLDGENAICKLSGILTNLAKGSETQEVTLDQVISQEGSTDSEALEEFEPEDDSDDQVDSANDEEILSSNSDSTTPLSESELGMSNDVDTTANGQTVE